ncbi:MAG: ABC transporter ATP-binding protein [Propionibacteriaceae bacterium]|nr:ABC transporter ATP-binding protein [Propionibacteriaceae bacterium]
MSAVASLTDVTVRRGAGALLLDDVSLHIEEGERWVVIGPNGAGKTTLLAVLSSQLYPSAGTVSLLGETLGKVDVFGLRPRIGIASPSVGTRVPGHEPVRDVVVSAAYGILGRWREAYDEMDLDQAARLLDDWQVGHLADRSFGTLSDGERKRVEIARALMTDPELLLLDEPGAGLDLAGREGLVRSLTQLCLDPDSPTIVLVTHHLEEIPEGISHALLLNHGQVVAAGPVDTTLTSPNLSETYEMPLRLLHEDGRWSARSITAPSTTFG